MEAEKYYKEKFESLDESVKDLPIIKKAAICNLVVYDGDIAFSGVDGNDYVFAFSKFGGFEYSVILKNVENMPDMPLESFEIEYDSITMQDGKFHICCNATDANENEVEIDASFHDIATDMRIYNALEGVDFNTPWESLCDNADSILIKDTFPENVYNERETKALPLIKELSALSIISSVPCDESTLQFAVLSSYFRRYGAEKLIPSLEKIAKKIRKDDYDVETSDELFYKLGSSENEPMFREIYGIIKESQDGYVDSVDKLLPTATTDKIKEKITARFNSLGYEGSYPDFTNHGELKGLHKVESYNESYLLLNKKNVYSHIHCQMEYYGVSRCDDELDVKFLCATEVLKDGETLSDYITCSFNFRGEKFFKTVTMKNDDIDEIDYDLVEQYVDIAAKTAECAKLTKAERKLCGDGIGDALKSLFN